MEFQYIIVQAGGKGTRMEYLTRNKPKALVPINNLPMLFHLFRRYPDKKFVIIGDYKYDVLKRYLKTFATVDYTLVNAFPHTGTCAGVTGALEYIPHDQAFLLIWSDLLLPDQFVAPEEPGNYIGIAKDFPCRWKYENGVFQETRSDTQGVAGLFFFENKACLDGVPEDGEFVRWLSMQDNSYRELPIFQMKEYGLLSVYDTLEVKKCRPFNSVTIDGEVLTKRPLDQQGVELADKEIAWYRYVQTLGFKAIPQIFSFEPLSMEVIHGKNLYELTNLSAVEKTQCLQKVIAAIKNLHSLSRQEADENSYYEAYFFKTVSRLDKIKDLVPFADDEIICINGQPCKNIFYHFDRLQTLLTQYFPQSFRLIHGDCTFSNLLLKENGEPVFIDPRGYFGHTKLYGDPAYDWAKLYYSLVGNYDQFNLNRFDLSIREKDVQLTIESNGWEFLEDQFFSLLHAEVSRPQMQLFHGIIWLSLTTYAWENYDSICGAFYNGLYQLRGIL